MSFFRQHPPTDNRDPTHFEFLSCFVIFHSNFIRHRFELKLSQLCPIVALVNQNHTPSPSHNGRGNQEPCAQSLGESRKPVEPCSIVIFGASGDLTSRKLIPALYHLVKEKQMPPEYRIIGFARREKTDESWRQELREALDRPRDTRTHPRSSRFAGGIRDCRLAG